MDTIFASNFFNTVSVEPRTDPESEAARFAVERFRAQLERIIEFGSNPVHR